MPPWHTSPDWDYDEYLYDKYEATRYDQDEFRYRQRKSPFWIRSARVRKL